MLETLNAEAGAVLTPAFMLKLGDQNITEYVSARLLSLNLTDHRGFEAD